MSSAFKAVYNTPSHTVPVGRYGTENAERVNAFHRSFPGYMPTPLRSLPALAGMLGIRGMYVKDESWRFGLNAFKVLGGSYAVGRMIADRLGRDIGGLPYGVMTSPEVRSALGDLTLVTATDGNHGRGVAWTANRLKQRAVVYMPRGTARERLDNILALGADASITDLSYDEDVVLAAKHARENGWLLIQDTSWDGYEEVPARIMEGYTTIGFEIMQQLSGMPKPTHLFLQAGVGSMAAAIAAFFRDLYGSDCPRIAVIEPDKADCFYRSAAAGDGETHAVAGEMDTIMAGLACGVPCPLAWNILHDHADCFVSMPDTAAALGMRILGAPAGNDPRIISGESGASTSGFTAALMTDPALDEMRRKLGMDKDSVVLCISTEGATDRENYRRVVWDGAWPVIR